MLTADFSNGGKTSALLFEVSLHLEVELMLIFRTVYSEINQ